MKAIIICDESYEGLDLNFTLIKMLKILPTVEIIKNDGFTDNENDCFNIIVIEYNNPKIKDFLISCDIIKDTMFDHSNSIKIFDYDDFCKKYGITVDFIQNYPIVIEYFINKTWDYIKYRAVGISYNEE